MVTTEHTIDRSRWQWLKPLAISTATIFVLLVCAKIAPAQLPSPGYVFLEITDEANKPIGGAAAVFYDNKGNELSSTVSDPSGRAHFYKGYGRGPDHLVVRVIRHGYLTHESILERGSEYSRDDRVKIKLVSLSKFRHKTVQSPRAPAPTRSTKRAPPPTGLSPPTKTGHKRARPSTAYRPHDS